MKCKLGIFFVLFFSFGILNNKLCKVYKADLSTLKIPMAGSLNTIWTSTDGGSRTLLLDAIASRI